MRTVMRRVLGAVGLSSAFLGLAACATNRAALHPLTEADLRAEAPAYAPSSAPAAPAPAPAYGRSSHAYGSTSAPLADPGPMSAQALARRAGLSYQDGGTYVLLSNATSRIRLYPDTRLLSIDGSEVEIRGRIVRQGPSVIVPGPAVALVESHLYRAREQQRLAMAAHQGMTPAVGGARVPAKASPRSAPARAAALPRSSARSAPGADPAWTPAGVPERPWRWIILHHSDDRSGNAAKYHAQHLAQGWENGLGYHFVIGNGTQSGDGEVEVGGRWVRQIQGAHAKTDDNCFNEQGVGICLVGNFENHGRPSAAQMDALVRLCLWLMDRYDIPLDCVKGHCDCKPTACPGKNFPWAELRSRLAAGR